MIRRGMGVGGALIGVLLLLAVGSASAAGGASQKVLIGFTGRPDARVVEALGGKVDYVFDLVPAIAASVPESAIAALARRPGVAYVEPDALVYASDVAAPGLLEAGEVGTLFDPLTEVLPWGIERVQAPAVWLGTPSNEGAGIKVGIIDTGIDYTQPDLAANYVMGYDFVNKDWDPLDDNGHGTHVAGIIAALDDGPNAGGADTDGTSVVGVGPQISLYIAKALDKNGTGYTSNIVAALNAAASNGVDVVNMSFGSLTSSRTLKSACSRAYSAGVLLVAAAGNESLSSIDFPARYPSVIAVGAINSANQRASFSNTGDALELCAPGVGVLSTMPTYPVTLTGSPYNYSQDYDFLSGTSMATPHVVGVAALVLAAHPTWTNVQVRQQLQATAIDLGPAGKDRSYGYGLVDAAAAAAP